MPWYHFPFSTVSSSHFEAASNSSRISVIHCRIFAFSSSSCAIFSSVLLSLGSMSPAISSCRHNNPSYLSSSTISKSRAAFKALLISLRRPVDLAFSNSKLARYRSCAYQTLSLLKLASQDVKFVLSDIVVYLREKSRQFCTLHGFLECLCRLVFLSFLLLNVVLELCVLTVLPRHGINELARLFLDFPLVDYFSCCSLLEKGVGCNKLFHL